jgi:hypothetical protein
MFFDFDFIIFDDTYDLMNLDHHLKKLTNEELYQKFKPHLRNNSTEQTLINKLKSRLLEIDALLSSTFECLPELILEKKKIETLITDLKNKKQESKKCRRLRFK